MSKHPSEKKGKTFEELYGIERANEYKKRMSENRMGHPSYTKGMKWTDEHKKKISLGCKGKKHTEESNKRKSEYAKTHPEYLKRVLGRREKSSLEIKMEGLLEKFNLPYKFVGNGEVIIGGKNPDFVNCNGDKIAVDVYYRRHKEQFRGGLKQWKESRQEIFQTYGWKLIFFDETEVNEALVSEKLR